MKNKMWTLVPKPKDTSIVDCKWLFKMKQENESTRYKARLVTKGFTQKEGIDFTEIFSSVVKYTTVRIILALTAHFNWELKQMDVKTTFLHGDLDETIYMSQPDGFISNKHTDYVCLLKKSLYGLKQSPRQWNKKFDLFMQSRNFQRSAFDPCLYFKYYSDIPVFLVLYVDDILIASSSITLIVELQNNLSKNFKMKDLGDAKKILEMPHWEALRWLLRYLNGSMDIGIIFSILSHNVNLVGWKSQLQNIVVLSTTEAEYIATTKALKEAIWLKGLGSRVPVFHGSDEAFIVPTP
ncbi:UNVERIFIED_CONTAM: Retrovirus-related Pol polyprotein from transposon TNT 1-94 [Sesamum radiatum]|uniref:Retrovirus-related Pol polyprotein from transposon TNT 1-94 n=1 Tax=Sesamum radiatum TaxID=300843 RepID=A0AAW2T8F7_SESRA